MLFRLLSSLVLFSFSLFGAVDGAIRVKALSTDSNNFEWVRAWFAPGQVAGNEWVRPFIDGTGATTWRTHNLTFYSSAWCSQKGYDSSCNGSVQSAVVNWLYSTTNGNTYTITFRNTNSPCSGSANEADCTAAGLDLTEALAFNGSNWDFVLKYAAAGGVTHSQSIRQMLTDGNACVVMAGPAMTLIDAGFASGSGHNCSPVTTRPYAFGIHKKKVLQNSANIASTDTTISIYENPWVAGATFPQSAIIRGSNGASTSITINSATSTQLTLASQVGATYNYNVSIYPVDGAATNTDNPSHSSTTMALTNASGFTAGDIACVRDSCFRIHSISSNTLTIGTTTLGANKTGWGWYGIMGMATDGLATGMPVVKYSDIQYYKATSTEQKNLSTRAYLLFVTGRTGVGAYLLTENLFVDRRAGSHFDFDVEIGVGGGTVIASRDKVTMSVFSKALYPDGPDAAGVSTYVSRGMAWSGSTPGDAVVDYNLPWLRAVGAMPLDPTTLADSTALTYHLTADQLMGDGQPLPGWDNSSKCTIARDYWGASRAKVEFDGKWFFDEGQGGSTDNVGEISSHQALALLLMDKTGVTDYARWRELVFGSAVCGFHQPVHAKSATNSGTFCGSTNNGTSQEPGASCSTGSFATVTPFGRSMVSDHSPSTGYNLSIDVTPRVGSMIKIYAYNDSYGSSHYYNICDAAYTLTGLPIWRDCFEGNAFGAFNMGYQYNYPFNAGYTAQNDRNKLGWSEKGIAGPTSGPRGRARTVLMLGSACAKLPSSPEKEVLCSKYKNNIAFWEGRAGFTGGNFYNSNTSSYDASYWRAGWWSSGAQATNDGIPDINSPVEPCSMSVGGSPEIANSQRAWAGQGMFQFAYFPLTLRWHDMLGLYHGGKLYKHYSRIPVNLLLNGSAHSGTGIKIFGSYGWPTQSSKQPQGSNITTCTGQPDNNTLGTAFQFVGSNKWLDYVQAMTSEVRDPAWVKTYPDLVRDRDYLWLASMTLDDNVNVENYSIKRAWYSLKSDQKLSAASKAATQYGEMPNMLWSPDWFHHAKNLTITPGTTTATVTFQAPDKATSCSYAVSSSPITNPSDSGDTAADVGRREVTYNLTSLNSATTYYFRLTCKDSSEKYIGRRHSVFTTN